VSECDSLGDAREWGADWRVRLFSCK